MRSTPVMMAAVVMAATALSGCEMIGDILQFGIWVGIIFMALIVGIIYWLFRKFSNRG